MPPAIPVELVPHSAEWSGQASSEAERLKSALGDVLVAVHHIGSTAIPGIVAKPILDLIPEVRSLAELDAARERIVALGYEWWGEYGLPTRRYCTLDDPESGARRIQLHCYRTGSPEITRHVAFRDYLRAHPNVARRYERVKIHARDTHPDDSHAYTQEKSAWIGAVEADALAEWRRGRAATR
jgi:GrpB-like predicted nucleotidyltransferase (UPF0157 family)